MSGEAYWSCEQPNFGQNHVRRISDLKMDDVVRIHMRVGAEDTKLDGLVVDVDLETDGGRITLDTHNTILRARDVGLVPSVESGTEVWSRYNWTERIA